jgi:hypothetical protein
VTDSRFSPPTWDKAQVANVSGRLSDAYVLLFYGHDAEPSPAEFDAIAFIEQAVDALGSAGVHGVASSSDYPGCLVSAAIARELGLPGPEPASLLWCSHKYYLRLAQRLIAPVATPEFILIDPRNLDEQAFSLRFPVFIKPVKSSFSQHARRIENFEELVRFVRSERVQHHLSSYVAPFNQLIRKYSDFVFDGSYMIAEQVLDGHQVTLEAFLFQGNLVVVGIVDSTMIREASVFSGLSTRHRWMRSFSDGWPVSRNKSCFTPASTTVCSTLNSFSILARTPCTSSKSIPACVVSSPT